LKISALTPPNFCPAKIFFYPAKNFFCPTKISLRPYENFAPSKQKFCGALSPSCDIPEKQNGKGLDAAKIFFIQRNLLSGGKYMQLNFDYTNSFCFSARFNTQEMFFKIYLQNE
jgi:hypothetical protein